MEATLKTKPVTAKAKAGPSTSMLAGEHDFVRGRDLAIELITEGKVIAEDVHEHGTGRLRAHRRGKSFDNYALPYLQRVVAEPHLLDGFAAILTIVLSYNGTLEPSGLAVPLVELQAGTVGADGTLSYRDLDMDDPDEEAAQAEATVLPERSDSAVAATVGDARVPHMKEILSQVAAIVEMLQREHNNHGLDGVALSALLPRLEQLANLGLSVADEDEPIDDLLYHIHGHAGREARRAAA